jgi:hypothetical protein
MGQSEHSHKNIYLSECLIYEITTALLPSRDLNLFSFSGGDDHLNVRVITEMKVSLTLAVLTFSQLYQSN